MIEELQTAWEEKCRVPQYQMYSAALDGVLRKIRKYYTKFNEKSVYVLSLILHLYYKLTYIRMAWGSSEEQKQEHEAGNPNAKDWHDKALQVIERMMEE
ncbi:hypothetical protein SCLCIDRAFT_34244 [Scleroderma citrinum Foug A]|uniref:Uncharacterized protein n=1 Tax=Scleroderma citrinum Foug A TaxID=1036808 RepID=A0A0C3D254_9AGAM|nr:hypothetical protein SCLCIDRAFT_34244 [Scleroderma citrinum Foug A]